MEILEIVFYAFLGFQLVLLIAFGLRLAIKKHSESEIKFGLPLSVIICARNEASNLLKNLPLVLDQHYEPFEVIVVDDASTDDTPQILKAFQVKYPNLRVVTLLENERFLLSKKYALTLGIKAAGSENLVLTDADCKPNSTDWLKRMAGQFSVGNDIVLAMGAYEKNKGFLNKLIRYDSLSIAMNYMGFALNGLTYMGVGRNLAYKKQLFFDNKGFASHQHIRSGDDDLFISEVAPKSKVAVLFDENASTESEAKRSFTEWKDQKARHLTTSVRYKWYIQMLLGLQSLTKYGLHLSFIVLILFNPQNHIAIGSYVLYWLIWMAILYRPMKRFQSLDILPFTIVAEYILLALYPIFAFRSMSFKTNMWKS